MDEQTVIDYIDEVDTFIKTHSNLDLLLFRKWRQVKEHVIAASSSVRKTRRRNAELEMEIDRLLGGVEFDRKNEQQIQSEINGEVERRVQTEVDLMREKIIMGSLHIPKSTRSQHELTQAVWTHPLVHTKLRRECVICHERCNTKCIQCYGEPYLHDQCSLEYHLPSHPDKDKFDLFSEKHDKRLRKRAKTENIEEKHPLKKN